MRQYRGLTKDGKDFVYGWCFVMHGHFFIIPKDAIFYTNECCSDTRISEIIEVIPETVGQSTGLKDKNGKEIYEGDIIEAHSETINNIGYGRPTGKWKRTRYTIEWKAPMFTKRRHENNYLDAFGIGSQELITKYYEIIGNIHQNPELSEKPK